MAVGEKFGFRMETSEKENGGIDEPPEIFIAELPLPLPWLD